MAAGPTRRLALLSVHPEYAAALVEGSKTVEFRKRRLAPDITHVAIYATHPVSKVVGIFIVREQVTDTPLQLWRRFRPVAGISKSRFLHYFQGHSQGVGIRLDATIRLGQGVTLEEAFGIARPPQSFQYFTIEQSTPGFAGVFD